MKELKANKKNKRRKKVILVTFKSALSNRQLLLFRMFLSM